MNYQTRPPRRFQYKYLLPFLHPNYTSPKHLPMPPPPASTLPPRPPILAARPPSLPFTRVIRITNVPHLATAWDLLAHFASASPISASQGKDLAGGYTIAYMNFASRADRDLALGFEKLWLIGRTMEVVAVSEGFSCEC